MPPLPKLLSLIKTVTTSGVKPVGTVQSNVGVVPEPEIVTFSTKGGGVSAAEGVTTTLSKQHSFMNVSVQAPVRLVLPVALLKKLGAKGSLDQNRVRGDVEPWVATPEVPAPPFGTT